MTQELTIVKNVTKSGKHTFAISIPKTFVTDNDLKIGSPIEVTFKKLNL